MKCANSQCANHAHDLSAGTLRLVERHVPPEDRLIGDESGFPVCTVPSRYLWLCPDCSEIMEIRGWTVGEIVFGPPRHPQKPVKGETGTPDYTPRSASTHENEPLDRSA